MNDNVSYNPLINTFEMDGVKLPSVSRILYYGEPERNLYWAMDYIERGNRIHELTEELDRGLMILPPDKEHEFEIECYQKALVEIGLDASDMDIEVPVYHPEYLYTGRPDRISKKKKIVLDIKTGKDYPDKYIMGLNAYLEMVDPYNPEHEGWRLINIFLRKTECEIKEYEFDAEVFVEFLKKLKGLQGE